MKTPLNILFNFRSKEGRASEYLEKITSKLQENFELNIIELDAGGDWQNRISEVLENNGLYFVAAGGDGTVHALLNTIVLDRNAKHKNLDNIHVGAIGLGSSNDFHKPLNAKIENIPIRLNFKKSVPWDIVQANLIDKNNVARTIYFSISGSIGLVAEANAFFNSKNHLLTILKKNWTQGAILYSALREILINRPIDLCINKDERLMGVSALCFLKTNYLSGTLKIDRPISHNDGEISFVLMKDMGRIKLLKTLNDLENNKFNENEYLSFFKKDSLNLSFEDENNIELDGEIYKAKSIELSILPQKIMVASNE